MKHGNDWHILPESEFNNWDLWVMSNPTGSWFHTIRAFEVVHERKPEILILKDDKGSWVAGFPFVRSKKFGLSYPKRSPFLYYSSPVIAPGYLNDIGEIVQKLRKQFSFSILNFTYTESGYPLKGSEFKLQNGWWLPLEKTDELQLERCESNHKRQIKKTLIGSIDFIHSGNLTEKEIGLVHQSYQDHGKESPYQTEKLLGLFSRLGENESVIARYRMDEKTLGWRCWLKDPRGFWIDWMSGISRSESTEPFGQKLCFESFRKAREEGASGIDFGGANSSGISEFKKRFGCEKRTGGFIMLTRNRLIKAVLDFKDRQQR